MQLHFQNAIQNAIASLIAIAITLLKMQLYFKMQLHFQLHFLFLAQKLQHIPTPPFKMSKGHILWRKVLHQPESESEFFKI